MLKKLFYTDYHADLVRVFVNSIFLATIAANIVVPIFITYLFYDYLHIVAIGIWLSVHVFIFIFRLFLRTKLLKVLDSNHQSQLEYYLKWYMVMVLATGILWGIFAVLSVLNTNEEYTVIILFVLLGLAGSSLMTLGSISYLFGSFITLILLPLSISLFYLGGEINYILGIWVLMFYMVILKGNTRYYALFSDSIVLNENIQKQQEKLIEHKTRYELIFDKALDGVLILEDGKFVECNESIVKMLNYTHKEELINSTPSMFSPHKQPDGRLSSEKSAEMMNLAYKHNGHQFEWVHTKATGEDFWCEIVLTPILVDEKEILHVVWRNISARKKIEKENTILKEQMELVYSDHTSGDGLWDWNILDDTAYLSPRWKSMLGYKDEELPNLLSSWNERVHPDDLEEVLKCVELSMSGKVKIFENIHRLRHKEGHWVWIYNRGQTIFDKNAQGLRMIGTHTDLSNEMSLRTELEALNKTLEIKVKEATYDLKKSQQQAILGSWKLDILTNTLSWSDVTYEIFELPHKQGIATYESFLDAIHPDDRENVNNAYTLSLENKNAYVIDYRLQMPDGRIKYVREHCETTFDEEGNPLVSIGTIQDITLEHTVTEEMRYKDELMFRQSRLAQMGEMISMIAHQWRQPLSAISSTVGALNLKVENERYDKEFFHSRLDRVSGYVQHLSSTIEDFRNFFHHGKKKEETTFANLIQSVLDIVGLSLESKKIKVETDYKCQGSVFTYTNEIRQVILTLIKNAEDAITENDIENPQITLRCYSDDNHAFFELEDNAGGIENTVLEKVFDPYFTTKDEYNGTGLGLYMSKTIVEEHCNGRLSAVNIREGALFKIELDKQNAGLDE